MTERPTTPRPNPRPADPRADEPRAGGPRTDAPRVTGRAEQPRSTAEAPPTTTLLSEGDRDAVTRRWHEIQAGFVDAPNQAVQDADALVADLLNRLTQAFAAERGRLESRWNRGEEVSTEDLRVALQEYRTFFRRLLSIP